MTGPLVAAGLSVWLPGRTRPVLSGLDLELHPGEVVGVVGRSGAGKSVLISALAGLIPWARGGRVTGGLALGGDSLHDLDPTQRSHLLSTCLDRPESQLFLPTVAAEMDAAWNQHHTDRRAAAAVTTSLDLGALMRRTIVELSSGERQRVALAAALAAAGSPLLLDEPTTHLDEEGVAGLRRVLREVKAAGSAVLLTEHAGWRLGDAVDRWLGLEHGRLVQIEAPMPPVLSNAPAVVPGEPLLELRSVRLARGGQRLIDGGALTVRAGEVVLLGGPNGSGKSSLARAAAGHALSAGVRFEPGPGSLWRPDAIAVLLPNSDLQLFAPTVLREVQMAGLDPLAVGEALGRARLAHLAARAPWTLSRGERQRLLLAALDTGTAPVLVLDEPAQGLDAGDIQDLVASLHRRAAAGGGMLLLSHRQELAEAAHRVVRLANGALMERPA
ncbi:MAG: ATP-binding cassette domain-containing protein [Thermoanaerobaculaceae bacterium]|jgi:energy-coupling factor transport system ATP-binding protein|nr:ATP-binding cassette domain-containing protein [Thermoanaerobaculaceae bacterium]